MEFISGIIIIGCSDQNIKLTYVNSDFENNNYIVNKNNWVVDEDYDDNFEVTIFNGKCFCKRTDSNEGWGMNLIIYAKKKIDCSKNINIPIFFINLDKDRERLISILNILNKVFDKEYIFRIEGVKHESGMEGCRLAHINAHIEAINRGFNYYVICEDDIKPLVETNTILNYISNSIKLKPDLVLFEQGESLEERVILSKKTDNMYRIFSGGNNTGCYLSSKEFGLKLIRLWEKNPFKHCDHSWQDIWYQNNVFFHRPQLFHQIAGFSNQNDEGYRKETLPFNWDLYEKNLNK